MRTHGELGAAHVEKGWEEWSLGWGEKQVMGTLGR